MVGAVSIWLLVAAFTGAGLFNALGLPATREGFARWGYPWWWCFVTGGLELLDALLIALPNTRDWGLVLGAVILAAALLTVTRRREFNHLAPIGVFFALIGLGFLST